MYKRASWEGSVIHKQGWGKVNHMMVTDGKTVDSKPCLQIFYHSIPTFFGIRVAGLSKRMSASECFR